MYYVYILWSNKLKRKYVGLTGDLRSRLKQHNGGQTNYTNRGIPWKLVYYEGFISKVDAEIEEKFLKSGKGRERLKFLLLNSLGEVA